MALAAAFYVTPYRATTYDYFGKYSRFTKVWGGHTPISNYNGGIQHNTKGNTMTTTTIIIAAMLTAIILPIIILGVQDARRHSWKPTNKNKKFGKDSDYMKAVKGGSKTLAEYHRKALAEGVERRMW